MAAEIGVYLYHKKRHHSHETQISQTARKQSPTQIPIPETSVPKPFSVESHQKRDTRAAFLWRRLYK